MSSSALVVVHPDADVLAAAAAARLIVTLSTAQAERGTASVVLTGGGIGTRMLAAVAASPARDAVRWPDVDVWWGDERFLPSGDAERNETGARRMLLDAVEVSAERVHAFPPPGAVLGGRDPDAAPHAAAALYQAQLQRWWSDGGAFDVVLLGVGPDGHVASLFPGAPALEAQDAVVAVRDAPKPPSQRHTLTLPAINSAREVWLLAAGAEKADPVRAVRSTPAPDPSSGKHSTSLNITGKVQPVPAARVAGRERTLLLVDAAAAGQCS